MSKIERTTNLELTKYRGLTLPLFFGDYSSDMQKIDDAWGTLEARFIVLENASADHETRITTLETCCNDVNITLSSYGDRLTAIENVIATVSTQNINDIIVRVDALEIKVRTNSEQIHELNDNLSDVQNRLNTAETNIRTDHALIEDNTGRIVVLESCCGEVRETLRAYDLRITKNTNDISDMLLRFERDEANIQANAQDIVIWSHQIETNAHNIDELTHALDALDPSSQLEIVRQVALNKENIEALQDLTASHTSTINSMIVRFTEDELRITDLERRMTIAEDALAQVGDWQTTIDNLSAQVTEFSDVTIPAIESDVDAIGDRVTALESFQTTTEAYETANDTRVAAVESRLTTAEGGISTLGGRVTVLESASTTLENALTALTTRVTTTESDIDAIEAEIGDSNISGLGNTITSAILHLSGAVNNINTLIGSGTLATVAQNIIGAINEIFSITGSTPLTTTATDLTGAVNELKTAVDAISAFSFVGMVVQGTNLATEADVKALYGSNTSWLQHSGYVLRGASSGVVANSSVSDGGNDTVTPSGNVNGHTLTVAEIPSHNHTISHTHTMNHTHTFNLASSNWGGSSSGNYYIDSSQKGSSSWSNVSSPSFNSYSGSTGGSSATNSGSKGGGESHNHGLTMNSQNNLPKYKNVYIWERIA